MLANKFNKLCSIYTKVNNEMIIIRYMQDIWKYLSNILKSKKSLQSWKWLQEKGRIVGCWKILESSEESIFHCRCYDIEQYLTISCIEPINAVFAFFTRIKCAFFENNTHNTTHTLRRANKIIFTSRSMHSLPPNEYLNFPGIDHWRLQHVYYVMTRDHNFTVM